MKWHSYYWRVIGYFLAGGGAGLVIDELIHGPFTFDLTGHETWGVVSVIIGLYLISKKPHGKDL